MFCPKCGSNQGERRFCTTCGANLGVVSQALQGPVMSPAVAPPVGQTPSNSQYLPPTVASYDLERQREYASGWKLLMLGSAALGYNILKIILSFGQASLGFWGFIGLVLFASGLAKIISWRQAAGAATQTGLQTVAPPVQQQTAMPVPTPNTAQLNQQPKPVFSALQPGTPTDEIEPARLTNHVTSHHANAAANFSPAITEDETMQLPNQKASWKRE